MAECQLIEYSRSVYRWEEEGTQSKFGINLPPLKASNADGL